MLEDALEHLVRGIVDHPDDVRVRARAPPGAGTVDAPSRCGCTPTTWAG